MNSPVAAIDIGTTSTNLLIADSGGDILRHVRVTRLGDGVDRSRRLSSEGMARTLATLAEFADLIRANKVGSMRIAATSASRDAENREEFFDQVESLLDCRPELLSGEEEARLSFAGALVGLDPRPHAAEVIAVLDIGGGSTELVLGRGDGSIISARSIDLGARRLTEMELASDPPRPEQLTNAIGRMYDEVEDVVRDIPQLADADRFIGVASTITVVAAVEIGLAEFDPKQLHGFELSRDAAEDVFRTLATESLADRVHNPGLPADRADVIVGGCCALVGVMRRLQLPSLTVSLTNLLDGLAAELMAIKSDSTTKENETVEAATTNGEPA
jgi:exopolyphosphatase / guanosine-5'-triphosphate,3'-diphosphate pyrophosphatase